MGFIKAAMMLQFRRIFNPQKNLQRLTTSIMVVIVLWSFAFSFIGWFPCFPISKAWNPDSPGRCYGLGAAFDHLKEFMQTLIVQSVTNLFLDLVILGLAVYMILRTGANQWALRGRLAALLTVGVLANLCAVSRTVFVIQVLQAANKYSDAVLEAARLKIAVQIMPWGLTLLTTEVNLAAICASVPVFWGPLQDVIQDRWNRIFVTQEVTVIRSSRNKGNEEDERDLTQKDASRNDSVSSEHGIELSGMEGIEHQKNKATHYEDEFVQMYINPLQSDGLRETIVQSEHVASRKWYE